MAARFAAVAHAAAFPAASASPSGSLLIVAAVLRTLVSVRFATLLNWRCVAISFGRISTVLASRFAPSIDRQIDAINCSISPKRGTHRRGCRGQIRIAYESTFHFLLFLSFNCASKTRQIRTAKLRRDFQKALECTTNSAPPPAELENGAGLVFRTGRLAASFRHGLPRSQFATIRMPSATYAIGNANERTSIGGRAVDLVDDEDVHRSFGGLEL